MNEEILNKLNLIIDTINITENIWGGEEFNSNSNVLNTYRIIYGEDALQKILSEKNDLHLNAFYRLDSTFENVVSENDIDTAEANIFINRINAKNYTRKWLKIWLIRRAISKKELELAEDIINELNDEDKYIGHRLMLLHYALTVDIENFKFRLKLSLPGKFPRNEIGQSKSILIENYSKKYGYEKGIDLCNDKIFEKTSAIVAVKWTAHLITLDEIDNILVKHNKIEQGSPNAKAILYVAHFYEQKYINEIPNDEFEKVINELMKIDKDVKCGDFRLRDFLFIDFGASTLNKNQITNCKKMIISPIAKRELNYHLQNVKNKSASR